MRYSNLNWGIERAKTALMGWWGEGDTYWRKEMWKYTDDVIIVTGVTNNQEIRAVCR